MKSGFTLVELLIAISIITVLSTIGFTSFQGTQGKAGDSIRKGDLRTLATALELYFQTKGEYITNDANPPCQDQTANVLYKNPDFANLISGSLPKDPKNQNFYCYESADGLKFKLTAKLDDGITPYILTSEDFIAQVSPPTPPPPPPSLPPSLPTTVASTTYTIAQGFSGTQGQNNWYYYWVPKVGGSPTLATYRQGQMCMGLCSDPSVQPDNGWQLGKNWFGEPDNLYWTTADGRSWMAVDPDKNTGGDNEIALIYWKAPSKGSATITAEEKRIEEVGKGTGFTFGVGYSSAVGQKSNTSIPLTISSGTQNVTYTVSYTFQMQGNGDALYYFKDNNGSTEGDTSSYTITIGFTPN